jgi:hypothetical protein
VVHPLSEGCGDQCCDPAKKEKMMKERIIETVMQVRDDSNSSTLRNQSNLRAPIEEAAGFNMPIQSETQSNTRQRTAPGRPTGIKRGHGQGTSKPIWFSTDGNAPSRQKKRKKTDKWVNPKNRIKI